MRSPSEKSAISLVAFSADLQLEEVPEPIRNLGKWLTLDTLGCLASGASTAPAAAALQAAKLFGGESAATVYGTARPVPVARALYANARISNLLDFDETYPTGAHFGIAAVTAAIAAAEVAHASPQQLLLGIICGYEAGARLASAIGTLATHDGGQLHYARTWGVAAPVVLASCVAYAKVLNLGAARMAAAVGVCTTNTPLPIGAMWSGSLDLPNVKYCDAGWCAVAGLHGVEAALTGTTGYPHILSEPTALLDACASVAPNADLLHEGLGVTWFSRLLSFKPWPSCRFMHTALTALHNLLQVHPVDPADVAELVLEVNSLSFSPRFMNADPATFCALQFSYPHAAAMLLLRIPPGPRWFDPDITESREVRAVRSAVRVALLDCDSSSLVSSEGAIQALPCRARLVTRSGAEFVAESSRTLGDPGDPATEYGFDEVVSKFRSLCRTPVADDLVTWLASMEESTTLAPLLDFLKNGEIA
jgi:2-methylcitrate dehydratase PrpD